MKLLNLGCGRRIHPAWVNLDFCSTGPGVVAHDLGRGLPFGDDEFDGVYHSHLLEHLPKARAPLFLRECRRVLKPKGVLRVAVPDLERMARLYLLYLEGAVQGDPEAQKRYEWIMLEMFDQVARHRPGGEMLAYWKRDPMPAESFVVERAGSEVADLLPSLRGAPSPQGPAGRPAGGAPQDALEIGTFRLSGEVHLWMYDRYSLGRLLEEAGFQGIEACRADESRIPDFDRYLLDREPDGRVRKPDSLFMEANKP